MKTAIPERTVAWGWVLYDGDCTICTRTAQRCRGWLERVGFQIAALQTAGVDVECERDEHGRPTEMVVVLPDGKKLGGADGFVAIARRVWWGWPLYALAQVPGVMELLRAAYRYVAARRTCSGGACTIPQQRKVSDWLMLVALPVLVLLTRDLYPAWLFMWLLAWSLFFGCKWLTWRRGVRVNDNVGCLMSLGYLFGWVGMDTKRFFRRMPVRFHPKWSDWVWPVANILTGAVLIWMLARQMVEAWPIVAGWTGMVGIVLCLHFGLFQLVALMWRRAGVMATPLMQEPWRSASLAEFWGRRWNSGFHDLANELIFRPLIGKCGTAGAMLMVFLVSGLIHDLIISVPARGGYGLPTAYFLFQGLAVLFERTTMAKRIGLGRGWRGWSFVVICTMGPAYWLFHPIFIHNVILPMLQAIGAT